VLRVDYEGVKGGCAVDLPSEPGKLTWREAFWRFCALWFVRARLGEEPMPAEQPVAVSQTIESE
jgi:hypothetical protein